MQLQQLLICVCFQLQLQFQQFSTSEVEKFVLVFTYIDRERGEWWNLADIPKFHMLDFGGQNGFEIE
jgi:hypothetical protein